MRGSASAGVRVRCVVRGPRINRRPSPTGTNMNSVLGKLKEAGIPLPPDNLIFMDKSLEAGLRLGSGIVRKIKTWGADVRSGPFLDIGCGWGRISYALLAREFSGQYIGTDVMESRVRWL